MRKPTIRTRRILSLSAAPVAVLVAGLMVGQGSSAAFTASTRNAGNAWSSGSLALTNDSAGKAGFTVSNVTPGQTGSRCMVVTATSSVPGVIKAYTESMHASGKGLEKYIKLSIEPGTGGTFNDCGTFNPTVPGPPTAMALDALAGYSNSYATGMLPWTITGTPSVVTQTYKGTWTFDTTGLSQAEIDALQGSSVSLDFVWELQNS